MFALFGIGVFLTVCCEAYLTHRMHQYFGQAAHNAPLSIHGGGWYALYATEAIAYDGVSFGTLLFFVLFPLFRRLKLNGAQKLYLSALAFAGGFGLIMAVRWKLYEYFKTSFDFAVLRELTEGKYSNLLIWVGLEAFAWLAVAVAVVVLAFLPVRFLRKQDALLVLAKPVRRRWLYLGGIWAILIANHFAIVPFEELRFGLSNKASYWLIDSALSTMTDLDRDGFGPLTVPRDPNNLNAKISPYALDLLGNGIDEDALGGDLVKLEPGVLRSGFPPIVRTSKPRNAIVIVVETFRTHVAEEPTVMPFLTALIQSGAAYNPFTYSNYGATSRAIQSVLFGSLHYGAKSRSLFDAFRDAGYLTFGVSAQSENWGNTASMLRFDQLTRYYDVRHKKWDASKLTSFQKRNKEFALFLDSREVNQQIFSMIDGTAGQPFVMYVNYQDMHYPYFGEATEKVFVDSYRGDAGFFRPQNRDQIIRQYQNAAHHLDGGIKELFDGLRGRGIYDDTVIVIVGDHPDSFYENGIQGHAWTLDEHQRRTPLVVVNGKGRWFTPMGQDEIARLVVESVNQADAGEALVFEPDPGKRVFELTGILEAPRQLALISPKELLIYDFKTDRWQPGGGARSVSGRSMDGSAPRSAEFLELVHRWESERVLRQEAGGPLAGAGER